MARKRSTEEIIRDILILSKNNKKVNQAMIILKVNISHALFNNYLNYCLKNKLIIVEKGIYTTTEKGCLLLKQLESLKKEYGLFAR